ncbi:MAG: putative two-component system sensor kinase [Streptosporangiaceae bacterium]|jgi:signal transduction histidine kinase|nr:putative two-component system sensor kinase [Streptosporangiaceae bacterium]
MTLTARLRWASAHAPWSAWAWRNTTFAAAGVPLQLVALVVLVWPWTAAAPGPPIAVLFIFAGQAVVIRVGVKVLTAAQRHRFWALLGVDIPPILQADRRPGWRGAVAWVRWEATWRQIGYHALAGPAVAAGGLLTIVAWATGIGLAMVCSYAWLLPDESPLVLTDHPVRDGFVTAAGVALLLLAPAVAALTTRLDLGAAALLLGPSHAKELERRVEDLTESRAGVVDAADAERRRIERDLHDGAQQRLVSLALNLGIARETLADVPSEAMQVIVEAHEEAKEALTELRGLVRGLHPAILDDRGLDAALSGIAARAPLPVRLRVDVPERASPTVEAVAYFVASETLTNVSKHARASEMEITVERLGDVLRMTVTDDGVGGADPSRGTGLSGLVRRVASVDGTFRIASPAGGPTVITVELPCAL